ncbi:MAG: deaminase [Polyangia bacterium]|jgi:cytidine deaminase
MTPPTPNERQPVFPAKGRPELVVGLVGAIGLDLGGIEVALDRAFHEVEYRTSSIHLIDVVLEFQRWKPAANLPYADLAGQKMDAGDQFRSFIKRDEALAIVGMLEIRRLRKESTGQPTIPLSETAFLLHSLKTRAEVEILRRVYGPNFILVAGFCPKKQRLQDLKRRIGAKDISADFDQYEADAARLASRDEREHRRWGQDVRSTFPLADVFLNASDSASVERDCRRFVELLFGHPTRTPTRDEFAMFQAYGAAMRSSSPGRQVGATIATCDGEIVTVGTNEVAKAFGGQYWEEDAVDHRDHTLPDDPSKLMTESIVVDLLARLRKQGWLDKNIASLTNDELLVRAKKELLEALEIDPGERPSLAQRALILNLIEFLRIVHAEMAAITAAARRGARIEGCVLYSTTFPCHECARHIVAAGIKRVVFIEPYPKSKVLELYQDSIILDERDHTSRIVFDAFVGIAPRRYLEWFAAPARESQSGKRLVWEDIRRNQYPRRAVPASEYLVSEGELVNLLDEPQKILIQDEGAIRK